MCGKAHVQMGLGLHAPGPMFATNNYVYIYIYIYIYNRI